MGVALVFRMNSSHLIHSASSVPQSRANSRLESHRTLPEITVSQFRVDLTTQVG
jgi:hypothetical protein